MNKTAGRRSPVDVAAKARHWFGGMALVVLSAAALLASPSQLRAQETAPSTTTADTQTAAIVDAAEAFLATLSDEQRAALSFDWTDAEQRQRWSNFPEGIFQREGVRWGDLDEPQRAALTDLLGTVLSPDGLRMVQEQMAADDVLAGEESGGGGGVLSRIGGALGLGGPGDLTFGSDWYYVSLLGQPSESEPWMLQFGGHHLAINATVVGHDVTLSPSLTGGQPVRFTLDGQEIDIVVDEVTAAAALLASFDAEQRGQAVVGTERIDLVLGPGKDGMILQPEGLPGSEMSDDQKALFLALIESRLGMLNEDDLAATLAPIQANLDATSFAWFGPEDDPQSSYWRVTGPTVILEFSPQEMGGDPSQHLHNMYREPTNEYGAAWTSAE